jgi:hypothetical protein
MRGIRAVASVAAIGAMGATGCDVVLGIEDPVLQTDARTGDAALGDAAPDDAAPDALADAGGLEATVYEVQQGTYPVGTEVTLTDVVVTAVDDYGTQQGPFWVAEPAGGEYSGMMIWPGSGTEPPIRGVARGARLDITGAVTEFASGGDVSGRTQTELVPTSTGLHLVFHGEGNLPPVSAIDPAVGSSPELAEPWEGVLVRVDNVRFFAAWNQPTLDPLLLENTITGPLTVQTQFAAVDEAAPDDCYTSVTGILDYRVGLDLLMPRDTADLGTPTGTCLPDESSAVACGNGTDDDLDGNVDCADPGCADTPSCS